MQDSYLPQFCQGDSLRVTEQCRQLFWFWFLKLKRVELRRCSSHPHSEVAAVSSEPCWHGTSFPSLCSRPRQWPQPWPWPHWEEVGKHPVNHRAPGWALQQRAVCPMPCQMSPKAVRHRSFQVNCKSGNTVRERLRGTCIGQTWDHTGPGNLEVFGRFSFGSQQPCSCL